MNRIGLSKYCLFCEPWRFGQAKQVLLRSDNFYLFAGLGPIVKGYIIIAPYRCDNPQLPLRSLSEAPPELIDELTFLRGLVSEFYRDRYGQAGMHFEHGRAGACLHSRDDMKHCYHAHLCCYPKNYPLWEDMIGLKIEEIESLYNLRQKVGICPYLFVQVCEVDESRSIDSAQKEKWEGRIVILEGGTELESQYLRRLLASHVGQPYLWDWETYSQKDLVDDVIKTFHDWLPFSNKYVITQDDDGVFRIDFLKSIVRSNQVGNDYVSKKFFGTWYGLEQYGAFGRFLRWLPNKNSQRPCVLDAGCGIGNYLKAMYHLSIKCVGIDISDEMLKIAQEILQMESQMRESNQPIPPPKLIKMNAFEPEFEEQSFDGIWYSAVFVHVPKVQAPRTLASLRRILKDDGVLYLSAQLGSGCVVRWEGRVFFYYTEEELQRLFRGTGFKVIEEWNDITERGSLKDTRKKFWKHYILKKQSESVLTLHSKQSHVHLLSDLGERGILEHIKGMLPLNNREHVVLGVGDDCAAVRPVPDELIVITTDPCPQPVISLLGENDRWYDGWFSMIISLSDIGSMGARPLGILLAVEAEEDMAIQELDRFYAGVLEASITYDCPVLGGNIKDAHRFSCVGMALGSVHPERMLRRDTARNGEWVVVLGDMGRFWAGVIHRLESIPLDSKDSNTLLENLRRPRPRIREGRTLSDSGLARCAIDSSDGLVACFYEIARAGDRIDVHIDLSEIKPDPIVKKIADVAEIDVRKLMLSWGDWEIVCTVADNNLGDLQEVMRKLGCPVSIVGFIAHGNGDVWFHDQTGTGRLTYIASERFTRQSYFSHGLNSYLNVMREEPLFRIPCKGGVDNV